MAEVRLRDFSRKVTDLRFTAEGEEYECVAGFSPEGLQELLTLARGFDGTNPDMTIVRKFFELAMLTESFVKFSPRLDARARNPITLPQCADIMSWLVEEYGQRPIEPSSNSTMPSETDEDGTSLMDGVQLVTLTP